MADLTAKARSRGAGDGHEAVSDVGMPAAHADPTVDGLASRQPLDPRSVRARLAPSSGAGDETPVRLSPIGEPLRMTNPSVGVGPLGGTTIDGEPQPPTVLAQRQFDLDGERVSLGLVGEGHDRHTLQEDGVASSVILGPDRQLDGGVRRREVLVDGFRFEVDVESERIAALRERAGRGRAASARHGSLEIRAIIPGRVVSVSVAPGDAVTAGMQLLVVEAMKMQNELRAPRDGAVEQVAVRPGATIEVGDLLVVIS